MPPKPPTAGTFSPPPADAPHEVAVPLDDATLADHLARARANERTLAPFDPPPGPVPAPPETTTAGPNAAEALLAARQAAPPPPAPAIDPESPTRGVPKPITDPGKVITGGFGHLGEAQYYAINGLEAQELVRQMLDTLHQQITNDLRFSLALTYPKLTLTLELRVEGWAEDAGFSILQVKTAPGETPLEVARQRAHEVVFVLRDRLREFDETGAPENPPDRMREAAGLPIPRKQIVPAGAVTAIVDVVPTLDEIL